MKLTEQEQQVIENKRKTEENNKMFYQGVSELSEKYNRVLIIDGNSPIGNPQITIAKKDETGF